MKKTTVSGALLAGSVAMMFLATPSFAQTASSSSSQSAKVKCIGGNSCKGMSACKTATSAGPGKNACKGHGMVYTTTIEACLQKGGKPMKM